MTIRLPNPADYGFEHGVDIIDPERDYTTLHTLDQNRRNGGKRSTITRVTIQVFTKNDYLDYTYRQYTPARLVFSLAMGYDLFGVRVGMVRHKSKGGFVTLDDTFVFKDGAMDHVFDEETLEVFEDVRYGFNPDLYKRASLSDVSRLTRGDVKGYVLDLNNRIRKLKALESL